MLDNKVEEKKDEKKKGFWAKIFNKDKVKGNNVAVIYLRNNGNAQTMIIESKKGFFNINNRTYHEDRDCVYTIEKDRIPLAIIPEWSLIPYGTKRWHDKEMLEKFSDYQDHVLRGIRHAELVKMGDKDQTKINAKTAILWGLGIIVAIAVMMGYK